MILNLRKIIWKDRNTSWLLKSKVTASLSISHFFMIRNSNENESLGVKVSSVLLTNLYTLWIYVKVF